MSQFFGERTDGVGVAPRLERRLIMAAQDGDARARDQLVEAFLPAIGGVARRYRSSSAVKREELIQDGVVGLLRALERFDLERGTPFWAYASWWVRQAMQDLVSELTHPVVLSDRALRQLARVRSARATYVQEHGREPCASALAEATGLGRESLEALAAAERRPRGLEEPVRSGDEGSSTVGEQLADERAEDAFADAVRRLAGEELRSRPTDLGRREREILGARFGFGVPEQTLQEVGDRLGVSAERVRQIEQRALEKLRAATEAPASRPRPRAATRAGPRPLGPRVDICASATGATVRMDVPGVQRDALRVRLQGSLLIVRGSRAAPLPQAGSTRERRFGVFERILRVPRGLDPRSVRTNLADGVLTVRIPVAPGRSPEAA
jgi:RNA polymerase primary sigma factor